MASKYRYRLTQRAAKDLDDIVSYMVQALGNPAAASRLLDSLRKAAEEACLFPESGAKLVNEFLPAANVRRKMIGNYVMYYLPDDRAGLIQVLRIVYGRRDLDAILKALDLTGK